MGKKNTTCVVWNNFTIMFVFCRITLGDQKEKNRTMYPIVVESKIVRLTIESIPTANHYFSRAVYQIEFLSRQ